ncbi:MAG: outer membrane protein assembly factor BamA [Nitrospirae bacterium]|nr:outer membrane protein assembly factor BamA [Nitrospirota bacterium]
MTRYILAAILILAGLCGQAPAHADGARPSSTVRTVAGVEFDYPGEVTPGLRSLAGISPGDRLSARSVRDAIKLLYLKGLFEDITVEGRDTDNGVVLVFRLVPRPRISDVDIDGNDELSRKAIIARMALKEGDFVETKLMEKSRESILKLYRDEGFPNAAVNITTAPDDPLHAVLRVDIVEGLPTIVDEIIFTGHPVLPVTELVGELEFDKGDILRKEDADNSVNALALYYADEDYVKAEVGAPVVTLAESRADLDFNVEAGPRLEVAFEGNRSVSDRKLRKVLTFWNDRDLSVETVSENLDRLLEYYKDEGWYFASLTSRMEEYREPPKVLVTFIVDEGPRVKLKGIVFDGNAEVPEDDLLRVMELNRSSLLSSRRITDRLVDEDVARLRTLYESHGYLKAEVGSGGIDFSRDLTEATLKVAVKEGPRTYVTALAVEGGGHIPAEDVTSVVRQKVGEPFSPQQLREDLDAVLNLYSQRGYIHAGLDVNKEFSEDGREVRLVYRLDEGMPVTIGKVVLRGNEDTDDGVITRELLFGPGDPYDYEKILKSQQKIYRLGFMGQVKVQPVDPEKVEPVKDVVVSVKEKDAGAVEFGIGYGDFDRYRGFAEVSYRNLFGLGHRISARGEASTKEFKAALTYNWPWFTGRKLDFRAGIAYLNAKKVNYSIKDLVGTLALDKTFTENITGSLAYQYENIKLQAIRADAVLAPEDKKKSNIASVTPSAVFDYRDDPFNPSRGSVHGANLKLASTYIGSTVDFVKLTAQTSWYIPAYKRVVVALSARGGIEGWFSEDLEVPISDRFFLGGSSSLRGFDVDKVAPKGADGTPAGGDAMLLANAEVRVPLPYGFGIVGFFDTGNVWLLNKNVAAAHVPQAGTNGLRYGAGAGLRYDTPVGPLRLDYGFNLSPLPGESRSILHFTLGQAF